MNDTYTPHEGQDALEDTFIGVTPEFVDEIRELIQDDAVETLGEKLLSLHVADLAELIDQLEEPLQEQLVEVLGQDAIDPEMLTYLSEGSRTFLLPLFGTKTLAGAVKELDSDDALQLLEGLDSEQQRQLLRALSARDRTMLQESLNFPEDSAGRLMQREVVCVPETWTVKQVLTLIRADKNSPSQFYDLFVVNLRHHPVGKVGLSQLLVADSRTKISTLMTEDIHQIPSDKDQEDVARLFKHYALVSAPVVDEDGRIIGMITLDDIVDVIEEEAEEDILRLARMSSSDFGAGYFETFSRRAPWLVATMLNGIITALVIRQFETSLSALTALSFFMPLPAMMGGNVGLQVVTVIVRAITTRDLLPHNASKALRKEVGVGFLNGLLFSILLGAFSVFFTEGNFAIGLVVFGALLWNIIWAATAGSLLPLLIMRMGMDPAISAGPILTVTTDILGYAVYLMFATAWIL